jgi:hypothetical protein
MTYKNKVVTVHYAYCNPCAWHGPERDMPGMAKADLEEHRKTSEMYLNPCSKAYAEAAAAEKKGKSKA